MDEIIKQDVINCIKKNPGTIRARKIKNAAGLYVGDSRYNGFLGKMIKEGLLSIEGSLFLGTRRWVVKEI